MKNFWEKLIPVSPAVQMLLNLIESLCQNIDSLKAEAVRLRELLEDMKRNKPGGAKGTSKDHSSDKHIEPETPPPPHRDRRSGKKLAIHATIHCPVDLQYQQTDDTSARVGGKSWNTHILCNPYYTYFSTMRGYVFIGRMP